MSSKKCGHSETSIGERLKTFRASKGFTIINMSKILGISHGALSALENDKSKPATDTLVNLCKHTDINIVWLLTGEGESILNESGKKAAEGEPYWELAELERLSPKTFKKVTTYLKGVVDGVRMMATDYQPYTESEHRKAEQHANRDESLIPAGEDRRSGRDRRKASAK